jgi:hypothetical protein
MGNIMDKKKKESVLNIADKMLDRDRDGMGRRDHILSMLVVVIYTRQA